jgi:predicted nucleic acid-binding protein
MRCACLTGKKLSSETHFNCRLAISITIETFFCCGRFWAELEACGKMLGFFDLIVGATALERGSEVATFNKRQFAQIKGLSVIEPK